MAYRLYALTLSLLVLAGCAQPVRDIDVSWAAGDSVTAVEAHYARRKPESALVAFEMRAARTDERTTAGEPVGAGEEHAVTVSGDLRLSGASVELRSGDRSATLQLPSIGGSVDHRGAGGYRGTVLLPAWTAASFGRETERMSVAILPAAGAHTTGEGAAVRSVSFAAMPEIEVALQPELVVDWRVPVSATDGGWRVEGLSNLVRAANDAIVMTYRQDRAAFSDRAREVTVALEITDADGRREDLAVRLRPGEHSLVVRPTLWGIDSPQSLEIRTGEGFELLRIRAERVDESWTEAVPIEMSELVRYPSDWWRREDFEVFSWSLYPEILWIDSIDYQVQARMFRRLAFFVEKRGYIGTLLSDDQLASRHGWNAHNYRPEGLAAFFNAVEEAAFPITFEEQELLALIEHHQIIVRDGDGRWAPGRGGILAISQQSYYELRRLLLTHEAMHGVFYMEPEFVSRVENYWASGLSEAERDYWRSFLGWMSYSPDDEYLMVNEFQAYLLQQAEPAVRWYFRSRIADRLRNTGGRWPAYVDSFLAAHPTTFRDGASAVNQALFEVAGMVGGDPYCIVPIGAEG